jgi:hypothetical protein
MSFPVATATGATGSSNATGANGPPLATGANGFPSPLDGDSPSVALDFNAPIPEDTLALLSSRALGYINHSDDIHLWKLLGVATNEQRGRFAAFVGVELPDNTAESQPLEIAVAITAGLAPVVLQALLPAINSSSRLERFVQWSVAPASVINYTASVFRVPSDAPEGWMIATAAHCSMIADYAVFESKWQAHQLESMQQPRQPIYHSESSSSQQQPDAQSAMVNPWTSSHAWQGPNRQGTPAPQQQPRQGNGGYNDAFRYADPAQVTPGRGFFPGTASWGARTQAPARHDYGPPREDRFGPRSGFDYQRPNEDSYQQQNRWESAAKRRRQDVPPQQKRTADEGMIQQVAYECSIPEATAKALSEGKFVRAADAFMATTITLGGSMQLQKEKPRIVSDDVNGVNMSIGALMRASSAFSPGRQETNAEHLKAMSSLIEVISIRAVWMVDTAIREHCDMYGLPYFPPPAALTYEIVKAAARFPRTSFSSRSCGYCGGDHGSLACRYSQVKILQSEPPAAATGGNASGSPRKGAKNKGGKGRQGKGGRGTRKPPQNANPAAQPAAAAPPGACRDFLNGTCNRGTSCKFSH